MRSDIIKRLWVVSRVRYCSLNEKAGFLTLPHLALATLRKQENQEMCSLLPLQTEVKGML